VIAFHGYGHDLPNVAASIEHLCDRHSTQITEVRGDKQKHVIYIQKSFQIVSYGYGA
jgi:hypothetical protein